MGGKQLRCAIYTRKSTEAGLEQDFNSLDAQREACEAYIKSQTYESWKLLPGRYDDAVGRGFYVVHLLGAAAEDSAVSAAVFGVIHGIVGKTK